MGRAAVFTSALTLLAHAALAQVSLAGRPPLLTADELAAILGGESQARAVVSRALREEIRSLPGKTLTVIGAQIPEEWFPAIPGITFVRLSDDKARTHLQECGRLVFVYSLTRTTTNVADVAVAEGNACSLAGQHLRFTRSVNGWRFEHRRDRNSWSEGGSHCGCR
jgi:hypothetical protein